MAINRKGEKSPEELVTHKNWYEVVVDGRPLGVLWPSKQSEEEVRRLSGLAGIDIIPASAEKLIEIQAKTIIPWRLYNRWQKAFRLFRKKHPPQNSSTGFDARQSAT